VHVPEKSLQRQLKKTEGHFFAVKESGLETFNRFPLFDTIQFYEWHIYSPFRFRLNGSIFRFLSEF
jgi:hypothetical protein